MSGKSGLDQRSGGEPDFAAPSDQIPLFLGRQTYRRRRMVDAARLLPLVGLVLVLMPGLWVPGNETGATASGVIYLFVVWVVLIIIAALISSRLKIAEDPAPSEMDQTGASLTEEA